MKHITFYFDFISPYAYLAFEKLPEALLGLSYRVTYKPVLFAAMLSQHGQLGPAEIPAKRDWTYRHVLWLAHQHGVVLDMPAAHPFNPLALLRLALASATHEQPNRYVCETVFRHVWVGGQAATDPARLQALQTHLAPTSDPSSTAVKEQLKCNTDEALALGAFGVPSYAVDGKLFWGVDALPMLVDYLHGGTWFESTDWAAASAVPLGITRTKS